MNCPQCGHENRASARFCGACAASLATEIICPACNAANPAGQPFCDHCAQPLAPDVGPPGP